jgi:L-amino acid N-acyltransferase YncA
MRARDTADAFRIGDAADHDLEAITAIYAHHVRFGFGSFEEMPPTVDEMTRRRADILARNLPYLVAKNAEGGVLGYAYASPYRARSAYRFSVEDSIYVAPGAGQAGIGRALLAELVVRCAKAGFRQMIAVIGDSGNIASISLHDKLGFRRVGLLPAIGFKHGRWIDSVLMQRELGDGAATSP